MSQINNNYKLLIQKLDQFIRKYYINKLIKGTLYSVGIVLALFTLFSVLEYYMYFPSSTRKMMFFSFVGVSVAAIGGWIFLPLLNYFKLGKVISHEKAASIIGDHFGNVQDKLLNVLQLKKQSSASNEASLINASINQKIGELNPVPFKAAINLNQNRKYLRFALPPLLLLLLILLVDARIIENGTTRLINNDTEFERAAPFQFTLNNKDLSVVQFDDLDIEVKVKGDVLPNEVFIDVDDYKYKLTKVDNNTFSYKFRKVAKNTAFNFTASGFDSKSYDLEVLKKPNIVGFDVRLDYPAYTGRLDEKIANIGDLVVPIGTKISWTFNAQNTDDIAVQFSNNNKANTLKRVGQESFTLSKNINQDATYMVYVSNEYLQKGDSVNYSLSAIPDVHPTIVVEQFEDSTQAKVLFFAGEAGDDYGLSKLSFHYSVTSEKGAKSSQVIPIKTAMGKQAQYDYTWDLVQLGMKPGDKLSYYFEVFDNDGINGAKSAKTAVMSYSLPSIDEYRKMEAKNSEEIKTELDKAIKESKKLQEDIKALQNKLLQKKNMDWQDRKELEKLLDRHNKLEKKIEEAKKDFDENRKMEKEHTEPDPALEEKKDKLEELFDEVLDEDMKDLMEKIEELLEEMNKEDLVQELENFEMDQKEKEQNFERLQELYKQLEFENEMQKATKDLEKLAEKQDKLSEESKDDKKSADDLKKEQDELNKDFDKVKEKLEDLEKKNEDLQSPVEDMDKLQEQSDDVKKDQKDSSQKLQKNQKKNASKSQKKASQKMKDMANNMNMMMQSAQMDQMQEDIAALRQLLENLVTLSFDQEKFMEGGRRTRVNTPAYTSLVQDQFKVKDDFALVEDSLNALAQRVFQIESFVTEKVTDINKDLKSSLKFLEDRKKSSAAVTQQRVMTGLNDLALMLSEVMEQMQQQMANQMKGNQMCQSPGQGQPMMKMGEQQQKLNQKLDQMMKGKEGGSPGEGQKGSKKGKGKGKGKNGWSKDFAEAAAQQAAIRKALRDMQKKKMEQGKGSKELQKMIDDMDKIETDLVNKKLNREMMKRQQDILSRMLEAAEAERQQEYENTRKADTAKNKEPKRPKALEDYIKKREAEIELYKSVSPTLKPYYKILVEEYYDSLKGQ